MFVLYIFTDVEFVNTELDILEKVANKLFAVTLLVIRLLIVVLFKIVFPFTFRLPFVI